MNSFAALDSDNEDEVVVQKPAKKEAAKAAPAATVAPVKAAPAASTKPVKAAGAQSAPKAPRGNYPSTAQIIGEDLTEFPLVFIIDNAEVLG